MKIKLFLHHFMPFIVSRKNFKSTQYKFCLQLIKSMCQICIHEYMHNVYQRPLLWATAVCCRNISKLSEKSLNLFLLLIRNTHFIYFILFLFPRNAKFPNSLILILIFVFYCGQFFVCLFLLFC